MSCSGEGQGGEGGGGEGGVEVKVVEVEAMSTLIHISQLVLPHSGLHSLLALGLSFNINTDRRST